MTPTTFQRETVLTEDQRITLENVPFRAGETVEITIVARDSSAGRAPETLRGTVLSYLDPLEPAIPGAEWEAMR